MVYSLTWLPAVLEDAGLKVAECPGWRTRGRGDVGAIKGVMCHHTAGAQAGVMPSLGTITSGRPASANAPALPGPLAQLALGRDGTFFVVAAGRANHAGAGSWQGIATGNSSFIGIEAENSGTTEPWPDVQLDAYQRGVAAILKQIGAAAIMCCGHKEYALPTGRKVDPDFAMDDFRHRVDTILTGGAQVRPPIPATDASGRPTLRRGASGALVSEIQRALGIAADGAFGVQTEAAVRSFQRARERVPDGIVGPKTWSDILSSAPSATPAAQTGVGTPAAPHSAAAAGPTELKPSEACFKTIMAAEGCRLEAYPDPATGGDPWTIGWGTIGEGIARGVSWTQQQCDERLASDVTDFAAGVAHLLDGCSTSQAQFDALTSFSYNLGLSALGDSTLLRLHRAGDFDAAAGEFGKWIHANGKVMAGLVKRRAAEAALYRG
ncbi:MAG: glycoside hydrolase family protein [Sphingomonadaceae bacterium]|nr:glycoside hydrolase family protein [Sphingomonadaceae bacterium]